MSPFHSGSQRSPNQSISPTTPLASQANRHHWDNDAQGYHERHAAYLESFYWCPEMLHEQDLQLVGDITDQTVLEIGCGSAPCSTWLAHTFPTATVLGFDISVRMLQHAKATLSDKTSQGNKHSASNLHLIQADATALPFAANSFDVIFSAFGALPFIEDLQELFKNVAALLRPGGRFIYSINHPMRWVFPDDPSEAGLIAAIPYFETCYMETENNTVTYIEFQHTFGDHVRALAGAGLLLENVIEPQWPSDLRQTWGQWSPTRGAIFPGTAIFLSRLP